MEKKVCQSCAMPLGDPGFYGTNSDDSRNEDYCIYCFAMGEFTSEVTMDEMIELNLEYLEQYNEGADGQASGEQARAKMKEYFPTLKRWSGNV